MAWVRLAFRARGVRRAADVDRALGSGRIVLGWLMRGTLHLVAREDYGRLLALTAPARVPANLRRLGQEGVPPEDAARALGIIATAVRQEGPLTREQLADRIAAAGIRTAGQATPLLLLYAALRGHIVAGPLHHDRPSYAHAPIWLNTPRPLPGDDPLPGDGGNHPPSPGDHGRPPSRVHRRSALRIPPIGPPRATFSWAPAATFSWAPAAAPSWALAAASRGRSRECRFRRGFRGRDAVRRGMGGVRHGAIRRRRGKA
ncbi:MAG: hypothetical protein GEV11_02540 [Streptosporangiales bacterium]|nr:hypothetical protein [Streptosporangiales bacterium]